MYGELNLQKPFKSPFDNYSVISIIYFKMINLLNTLKKIVFIHKILYVLKPERNSIIFMKQM